MEGKAAPDFKLPSSAGGTRTLKHYRGKTVVLYFYPADDTEGCTKEACEFRDLPLKKDMVIVGVSPDSIKSHEKFIGKYKLPFELLSDEDHKVCEKYGVWGEKTNFGHKYMGVIRSTFLIGPDGKVKKSWPGIRRIAGHAKEVFSCV
jgi:peroxiredoxin Q/BCP